VESHAAVVGCHSIGISSDCRHRWHFKLQTTGTSNCQFDDASRTAENSQTNEPSTARQSSKQIQLCKCRHQHGYCEIQIEILLPREIQRYRYGGNYATVSGTSTRDMPRWKCKGNRDKSQPHDILKLSSCPVVRSSICPFVRGSRGRTTDNGQRTYSIQHPNSQRISNWQCTKFFIESIVKTKFWDCRHTDLRTPECQSASRRSWCYFQLSLIKFVSESSAGRTISSVWALWAPLASQLPRIPHYKPSALSGATIYIIQVI